MTPSPPNTPSKTAPPAPPPSAASASQESVAAYAAAVASGDPTPGGGSAVAVTGALAAALAAMVCNHTIGRPAYADTEEALTRARSRADALRAHLLDLAAADEAAYSGYVAATSLPRSSEAEKVSRRAAMQDALVAAADVPLAVAVACADLLALLESVAALGNKHLLSDATVAALLAEAALRGATTNVRINADQMREPDRAAHYRGRIAELEATVAASTATVHEAIAARET